MGEFTLSNKPYTILFDERFEPSNPEIRNHPQKMGYSFQIFLASLDALARSRTIRQILCFVCASSGLAMEAVESEVLESRGSMVIQRFGHHAELINSVEHNYALASSDQGFRIRALTSWDNYEQGMLAISDWNSLYQANRVTTLKNGRAVASYQFGKFDLQFMPAFETYGWGPMQALALANYLLRIPSKVLDHDKLRFEFIPEIISTRGTELGMPQIRTQYLVGDAPAMRVLFWGIPKGSEDVVLSQDSSGCILLGELGIDTVERGLPTKMHFIINGLHVFGSDPKQPRKASPLSAVFFNGEVHTVAVDVFNEASYDPNVKVGVIDSRFPSIKRLNYFIKSGDPLPFAFSTDSNGSNVAQRAYYSKVQLSKTQSHKREILIGAIVTTLLMLILALSVKKYKSNDKPNSPS